MSRPALCVTGPTLGRLTFLYLLFLLLCLGHWFTRHFGRVEWGQLLFHLQQSPEGLLTADEALVRSALRNLLLAPLAYTAIAHASVVLAERHLPLLRGLRSSLPARIALAAIALTGAAAWSGQAMVEWPQPGLAEHDWIAELHAPPQEPRLTGRPRNLLLIYAESLEDSYRALGPDLLAPLDRPALAGTSFPSFQQAHGTGWTMAGIVASQCGLPLKPMGIVGRNLVGEVAPRFLPGARCLGDVLQAQGWHNVFMGGASAAFAGKGRFLREHGYHEVMGLDEWRELDPDVPVHHWGIDDDLLLDRALERLQQLAAGDRPFNLTLLTSGTHPPHGYVPARCQPSASGLEAAIRCSTRLLADFLTRAQARGLLSDTQVLIVGDHLMQKSAISTRLQQLPARAIFNRFIPAPSLAMARARLNHFDLLPTLLQTLGFDVPQGRMALGCSAWAPTLCNSLAADAAADRKLARHSAFYDRLWTTAEPREWAAAELPPVAGDRGGPGSSGGS